MTIRHMKRVKDREDMRKKELRNLTITITVLCGTVGILFGILGAQL